MTGDRHDLPDMKSQWDARARANARYYIATTNHESEAQFDASGRRDVALFFAGHEDLLRPDVVVLDLGCGIGRMDRHVAPHVSRLVGLDVSGEMVRRARERCADLPNVEFVEGDGLTLRPIGDASVDVVFSHIVFQHLPRRVVAGYTREAHRVLKPGGVFLFQVPEARGERPPEPPDHETFEMRFWTEAGIRAVLEAAGFVVQGVRRHRVPGGRPVFDHLQPRARRPAGA